MTAYQDTLLSKGVPETTIKADYPVIAPKAVEPAGEPTGEQIAAVYALLKTVEQDGWGAVGISHRTGVAVHWIKQLHRELKAAVHADAEPVGE